MKQSNYCSFYDEYFRDMKTESCPFLLNKKELACGHCPYAKQIPQVIPMNRITRDGKAIYQMEV